MSYDYTLTSRTNYCASATSTTQSGVAYHYTPASGQIRSGDCNIIGRLEALSPATIAAGSSPYNIAVSPDGNSVYTANSGDNTVSMYSRNSTTGALTPLPTPTISTGGYPYSIAVSSDNSSVYVTSNSTVSMYSRNATGALTALSTPTISTGGSPYGIAISPDGNSVYVTNTNKNSNTISMYKRNW